jgi:hypothetical protein
LNCIYVVTFNIRESEEGRGRCMKEWWENENLRNEERRGKYGILYKNKTNSVAFSPQANYTD